MGRSRDDERGRLGAAGAGLALLMVGAAATHRRRGELPMIGVNAVLLLLAVVVAWARFGPYPL
jgi:MYXO-CTERM domain-containing protein